MATSADPQEFAKPGFVEGGCLCAAIRYRIDFPENHDFKTQNCTCMCTQCRKQTGSLFFQSFSVPKIALRYIQETTTLKIFRASPHAERGFCGNCGSFLYWSRPASDKISISIGSIDPLYLFGEGADGQLPDTPSGQPGGVRGGDQIPKGGYGLALAYGGGTHEYCVNEIPGVTDTIPWMGFSRGKRLDRD